MLRLLRAAAPLSLLALAAGVHADKFSAAPVLKEATPAVVNISVRGRRVQRNPLLEDPLLRRFFNAPRQRSVPVQSVGSGVIIDADEGLVVTNHHVVKGAESIVVTLLDRRDFEAALVGSDAGTDVALLRIDAEDLTELQPSDSEALQVGDFVVAIGNPFGLRHTVTLGIVSALGRTGFNFDAGYEDSYQDFIQTDASINRGNSGGALIDLDGRLVGINTAIISSSGGSVGIGFAVPTRMVNAVVAQLLDHGEVRRGQLGVIIRDVTPDLAEGLDLDEARGALVSEVMDGSHAQEADIRPYDVIVGVDGEAIESANDLRNRVGLGRVGEAVELDLIRDGERLNRTVVIGERGVTLADGGATSQRLKGVALRDISPDHPLSGEVEGVEVARVDAGSRAAGEGLRAGDIILDVNRRRVASLQDFLGLVESLPRTLALWVQRGERRIFIAIPERRGRQGDGNG